jgi:hypothetical protein
MKNKEINNEKLRHSPGKCRGMKNKEIGNHNENLLRVDSDIMFMRIRNMRKTNT